MLGRVGAASFKASAATAVRAMATAAAPAMPPMHLAIPVNDIPAARKFYGGVMGCEEGRSAKTWIDFNFFGHQLVTHFASRSYVGPKHINGVDADMVPVPHFGCCLSVEEFHALAARLKAAGVKFLLEPHMRFKGKPGEQWTMFLDDPSGNSLEFKAMSNPANLFAKDGNYDIE